MSPELRLSYRAVAPSAVVGLSCIVWVLFIYRAFGWSSIVAGVAIVRDHNRWTGGWPVLVTVLGWLAILAGLGRMFAPVFVQQEAQQPNAVYALLAVLLGAGVFLTFKAYCREK